MFNRAPQAYFVGDTVKNLEKELARGMKLKCGRCGLKGAALGCYVKSCHMTYHAPCAAEVSTCRWDCVSSWLCTCAIVFSLTSSKTSLNLLLVLTHRKTFSCYARLTHRWNFQMRSWSYAVWNLHPLPHLKGVTMFCAYLNPSSGGALFCIHGFNFLFLPQALWFSVLWILARLS